MKLRKYSEWLLIPDRYLSNTNPQAESKDANISLALAAALGATLQAGIFCIVVWGLYLAVDFFSIVLPGSAWVFDENGFFNLYVPLYMFFLVFNWFHGRRRVINEFEDRAKSAQNQIDSPHEE